MGWDMVEIYVGMRVEEVDEFLVCVIMSINEGYFCRVFFGGIFFVNGRVGVGLGNIFFFSVEIEGRGGDDGMVS